MQYYLDVAWVASLPLAVLVCLFRHVSAKHFFQIRKGIPFAWLSVTLLLISIPATCDIFRIPIPFRDELEMAGVASLLIFFWYQALTCAPVQPTAAKS